MKRKSKEEKWNEERRAWVNLCLWVLSDFTQGEQMTETTLSRSTLRRLRDFAARRTASWKGRIDTLQKLQEAAGLELRLTDSGGAQLRIAGRTRAA